MVGKQIRLIIFDMDGTLYELSDVISMNYRMQVDFYSEHMGVTANEAMKVFTQNDILPVISPTARSATEFFSSSGMDLSAWQKYRNSHFDVSCIDVAKAVGTGIIKDYHVRYKLCLLTSNSYVNVIRILDRLEIPITEFDQIVCSDHNYEFEKFHKLRAMQSIMRHFDVLPKKCLSIGDRFNTDVAPALELGAYGIVVYHPWAIKEVYKFLSSDDCLDINQTAFSFYRAMSGTKR